MITKLSVKKHPKYYSDLPKIIQQDGKILVS